MLVTPSLGGENTPSLSSTLLANPQQDTKCSIFGAGQVTWTSLPSLERGTCSSIFHITFVHIWAFCCGVSDLELHDHFTLYDSRYVSWPLIVMAIMSHLVPDAADIEDNSFVQLPRLLDDERVRRLGLKLLINIMMWQNLCEDDKQECNGEEDPRGWRIFWNWIAPLQEEESLSGEIRGP